MKYLCHSLLFVLYSVSCIIFSTLSLRADSHIDVAALTFGDSGEGWTFDGTNLVLSSSEHQYVATGTRTKMTIRADADCTLVASNLSVSAAGLSKAGLDCNKSEVTLLLWSDNGFKNTFVGGTKRAGIAALANLGGTIIISNLNETAALNVTGGAPTSNSGAAGIGGGSQEKGGTIIIRGGIINATAGGQKDNCGGAGIGGGYKGSVTAVIISGGTVTATPAHCGAGIGSGRGASAGYVEISGGTVTAKGIHNYSSAIGPGFQGSGGTIVISGGTVTTSVGLVGIGGSSMSIRISGGTVSTSAQNNGIGGGSSNVTISGGRITASTTAATTSTAIGGASSKVAISGGTIKAIGKYQGIGRTSSGTAGTVTITGGTIMQSPVLATPVPLPTDGTSPVYELTIQGLTPNSLANVTGLPNNYSLKDAYADANGKIYVYLPDGNGDISVEGTAYRYTIKGAPTTPYLASETFDISFVNANPDKGTISNSGGSYPGGTEVSVVATPLSEAFVFDKWTGDLPAGVNARSPEITFITGSSDIVLTAHFVDAICVNGRSVGFGSGDGWIYSDNRLTLTNAGPFVIHGTSTYSRIFVDADCTIVASNLYVSAQEFTSPALDCNFHDVALKLWNDASYRNSFYGGLNKAGISVVSTNIARADCGAKLTITALNDNAELYVVGGSYTSANTTGSAGIGGGVGQSAGTIDIQSGIITIAAGALGSNDGAAAIGGGCKGSYHAITISGGTVSATGTHCGSAIGTGRAGAKGGVIAISGGRVTTSVAGGITYGYTIGGGYQSSGGTIKISGGTVSAPSGIGAPTDGAVVTITGGSVSQYEVNKPAPTDGSQRVYRVTTTVLNGNTPVKNAKVSVRVLRNYGVKDIYTDASGKLYFYLPNGSRRFRVDDNRYQYTVNSANTTAVQFFEWPTILSIE